MEGRKTKKRNGFVQLLKKLHKDRKTRKSRSEEKVVGFSSVSLFPAKKREAVTQGGTMEPGG